jgi:hypothetical protein
MMFGNGTAKLGTLEFNQLDFTANYVYNIFDSISQKSPLTGKKWEIFKGFYHKFEFNFHKISSVDAQYIQSLIETLPVFQPHIDNTITFTVMIKKFKPYHLEDIFEKDALVLTLETTLYKPMTGV